MSDVNSKFEGEKFSIGLDSDNDGIESIKATVHMNEAVAEAFKRGGKLEGAKVAEVKFEGMTAKVLIDTDKDGEPAFEFEVNLAESFDESAKRF